LLQPRSPVRIAGVDVGQVDSVQRYRHTPMSLVTMRIDDKGRPVHADATLKIRPRLFLEGNFFVDLKPGTPSAPELKDGATIPVTQVSRAVQLDQVLTSLPASSRAALHGPLHGLEDAFDSRNRPGQQTGAEALNRTLATSPQSLRDSAIVGQALVGPRRHDLASVIAGFARVTNAVAQNDRAATSLVRDFNRTVGALASRAPALARTVQLLGPTAVNARRAFAQL